MDTFPEDLRVSTMTAISKLSVHINLENLYDNFKINDVIKFIEFRDNIPKGFSKKALRKKRKKEVKKVEKPKASKPKKASTPKPKKKVVKIITSTS